MSAAPAVQRRYNAMGHEMPVGYVFMVAMRPEGPLRPTREEAVQDAVDAKEARIDLQYGQVFFEPLTWIAPVFP
jgi:hypothetical protein